jgi:Flp pilus assembly protein TadG
MAVIIVLLSAVLLAMAAFAVDLANSYAAKRQLSVAADASAIAAAQDVNAAIPAGAAGSCNPLTLQPVAQSTANAQNTAAQPDATLDEVTVDCSNWPTDVRVKVVNRRDLPTFFGQFAGQSGFSAANTATARVFVPDTAEGLRPIAACAFDVQEAQVGTTSAPFVVAVSKDDAVCGTAAPGNWGYVNFLDQGDYGDFNESASPIYYPGETCAGNATPSGGNANCQTAWTANGYGGRVVFPNEIADTGGIVANTGVANQQAYRDALKSLVGKTISLPVATFMQGSGSNARHNVVGVITVQVCSVRHWQASGTLLGTAPTACGSNTPPSSAIGFDNWDVSSGEAALWVKPVLFQTGVTTGGPRDNCFGDDECDFGQRAVQLYQ